MDFSAKFIVFFFFIERHILAEKMHLSRWIKTDSESPWNVYVFETLLGQGVERCIESCKAKKMCEYFNFDIRADACYLVGVSGTLGTSSPEDNIEKKAGYTFGRKSDWTTDKYEACSDCDSRGVCRKEDQPAGKYSVCENSGCGPPENKPFAVVLGNMFSIGDTIKYKCVDGYTVMKAGTERATCQTSGTWTSSAFKCIPVEAADTCFKDSCYLLDESPRNWNDAKQHCEERGGNLTDVKTQKEWDYLTTYVFPSYEERSGIWLGGNDFETAGFFKWLDGTAVSDGFQNWKTNQPDGNGGDQQCMAHLQFWKGRWINRWHDVNCNSHGFMSVCKFREI